MLVSERRVGSKTRNLRTGARRLRSDAHRSSGIFWGYAETMSRLREYLDQVPVVAATSGPGNQAEVALSPVPQADTSGLMLKKTRKSCLSRLHLHIEVPPLVPWQWEGSVQVAALGVVLVA